MYPHSFSFVIPAYNEEANIHRIIETAFGFLSSNFKNFEIIVIDDGSTDTTPSVIDQLISEFGNKLIILRHLKNQGYGAALRTGLFSAKNNLVFYTDADNQFDIREITEFMKHIDSHDIVIGYRKNRKDTPLRKFAARVYNRLIFLIFGLDRKDIDCSFKLFKKACLQTLTIETDEFLVDTELLVKAKIKGLKIKELPVAHYPRTSGKSSVRFRHVFTTIRDIFFLKFQLIKNQ